MRGNICFDFFFSLRNHNIYILIVTRLFKLDSKLYFEKQISTLCKKASQKLQALNRIVNYMKLFKRKALWKIFISQFNYCPLVWMFHSRKLNYRINSMHERALRVTYHDYKSTCLELLQKGNSLTIHQRNLQVLLTKTFKVKNDLSSEIMKEVFESKEASYSIRSQGNYFHAEMLKLPITVFTHSNKILWIINQIKKLQQVFVTK